MAVRFLPIILMLLCLMVGKAQDLTDPKTIFSAEVLTNKVPIGEFGTLIFKFAGGDVDMPQNIETPGLEITHSQKHNNFSDINGVSTFVTTHFYRFRSMEVGEYTIPAVAVPFKDTKVSTQPIKVTVYERDNSDAANATRPEFAKLDLEKTEFYVNEIVPFTVTPYVRGRNGINEVVRANLAHESFIFKGFREVKSNVTELGSQPYSYAVLPSTFFALKPGEHRLGPATVGIRVLESGVGRGLSAFFARTALKELATNTVTTKVKALPDGAPASFTGGVGVFLIKAIPSTTELNIGDPISMEFEVTGVGNLRTMTAPVFSSSDENWKTYEPGKSLPDEQDSDGVKPGMATFSQVIIPEFEATEIPPFELTYFNPNTSDYVTLTTAPIPIKVHDDGSSYELLDQPLNVSGSESEQSFAAESPTPVFEDMLHIRLTAPRWIATIDPGQPGRIYLVVQILFSVVFFTILGFGLFRWFKQHQRRLNNPEAPTSFKQAIKRVPKAGAPKRDFYHAVSTALDLWKKENDNVPPPVEELIEKLAKRCETFLYSGEFTSDSPIAPEEAGELHSILRRLKTS